MTVGAVIVNYNCAVFALDAALSVLGDDDTAHVVIVDNASTDGSLDIISDVLAGRRLHKPTGPSGAQINPEFEAVRNISTAIIDEGVALGTTPQLTIIRSAENRGFAAGCNIGIRYLIDAADPETFLLLNPDAQIARGSLAAFKDRLCYTKAGLCGATIMRFDNPDCAQAFGGAVLNPWTLLGSNIGAGKSLAEAPDRASVEAQMSYPLGAAIAFRKDYLKVADMLDARFFLYYEEADWVRRGWPARHAVWAPKAIVYHRHGVVAGSRRDMGGRTPASDFHMARSRMKFALKWRPMAVPIIAVLTVMQSVRRLLRGERGQAKAVLAGTFRAKIHSAH